MKDIKLLLSPFSILFLQKGEATFTIRREDLEGLLTLKAKRDYLNWLDLLIDFFIYSFAG